MLKGIFTHKNVDCKILTFINSIIYILQVPIDTNSRNPTVSSSTTFSKKMKKIVPPVISETVTLISDAPDFLRSLNIVRAPLRPAEPVLPCSKTETEQIIAAMKETLMASPAPTPVILPKKRKRQIYDLKQLAEKIAKHDHNVILDPKVEEVNDNKVEDVPIPVVVKNKGKKLMSEIEVGLIKQNRLRRKREIPSIVPEKVLHQLKKPKTKILEKNTKNVEEDTTSAKKTKNVIQPKKKPKIPAKKTLDENFISKIQTRNRKKNFIEELSSNNKLSEKEGKTLNNNELSSSLVDIDSSQEIPSSEVPPKKKVVKVNPFKPKAKNRRNPGVFFGSRKRKRNIKTENKSQLPTTNKVSEDVLASETIPKLKYSNSNLPVTKPIKEQKVLQNCNIQKLDGIIKTEISVKERAQESLKFSQNESIIMTINEEHKVTAPISADTTELKEPEEIAEPRWHTQSDNFFDLPSTVSLGSILSSVNQASKFFLYLYFIYTC